MSQERISIQSGTRDELGGVDVAIANVYERKKRAGVLSGILVLPEEERIIAPGDVVDLGGKRFRLEIIEKNVRGTFEFVFVELGAGAEDRSEKILPVEISPLGARALADLLMAVSENILAGLGFAGTILRWEEASRDDVMRDWRGNETGPSTKYSFIAQFDGSGGADERLEARVRLEYIRWSPQELSSTEVSGFWRWGEKTAHVFASARGRESHRQISVNESSLHVGRMVADAARKKS